MSDIPVRDQLAGVTADIDQAQALIDEARSKYKDDAKFQKELDVQQFQLDIRREQAKLMKAINDILDPK